VRKKEKRKKGTLGVYVTKGTGGHISEDEVPGQRERKTDQNAGKEEKKKKDR